MRQTNATHLLKNVFTPSHRQFKTGFPLVLVALVKIQREFEKTISKADFE